MFTGDGGNWTILLWPAALALAAIALLVWSWRGRRVGEHPHCRRCGFDLFGNPAANRCGECGADLTKRRAVVTGQRRRRPLAAATALFLALACRAWGGSSANSAGWFDRKPDWLLRWELGFDSRRPAALRELSGRRHDPRSALFVPGQRGELSAAFVEPIARRLIAVAFDPADFGADVADFLEWTWEFLTPPARREVAEALLPLLDADDAAVAVRAAGVLHRAVEESGGDDVRAQISRAAELLVARQGDRRRSWDAGLGDLFSVARFSGLVDDASTSRYFRQMAVPRLYARPRVRAADPLPWGLAWESFRGGSWDNPYQLVQERWDSADVAGIGVNPEDPSCFETAIFLMDRPHPSTQIFLTKPAPVLPVGRQTLSAAVTFRVTTTDEKVVLSEWRQAWAVPVEVVPPGRDVVRPVAAPGLAAAFADTADLRLRVDSRRMSIDGEIGPLPADVAALVWLEETATGRRWRIGDVAYWRAWNGDFIVRRGPRQRLNITLDLGDLPDADLPPAGAAVSLILLPDAATARRTADLVELADVTLRVDGLVIGSY